MPAERQLAELARRKEQLRARIRIHRDASVVAANKLLTPLRWIDLGLRVHRLFKNETGWWIAATMC